MPRKLTDFWQDLNKRSMNNLIILWECNFTCCEAKARFDFVFQINKAPMLILSTGDTICNSNLNLCEYNKIPQGYKNPGKQNKTKT